MMPGFAGQCKSLPSLFEAVELVLELISSLLIAVIIEVGLLANN
jgi:hypothetical protein